MMCFVVQAISLSQEITHSDMILFVNASNQGIRFILKDNNKDEFKKDNKCYACKKFPDSKSNKPQNVPATTSANNCPLTLTPSTPPSNRNLTPPSSTSIFQKKNLPASLTVGMKRIIMNANLRTPFSPCSLIRKLY